MRTHTIAYGYQTLAVGKTPYKAHLFLASLLTVTELYPFLEAEFCWTLFGYVVDNSADPRIAIRTSYILGQPPVLQQADECEANVEYDLNCQ